MNTNAKLLRPPVPILQNEGNWPLLAVSKTLFETKGGLKGTNIYFPDHMCYSSFTYMTFQGLLKCSPLRFSISKVIFIKQQLHKMWNGELNLNSDTQPPAEIDGSGCTSIHVMKVQGERFYLLDSCPPKQAANSIGGTSIFVYLKHVIVFL